MSGATQKMPDFRRIEWSASRVDAAKAARPAGPQQADRGEAIKRAHAVLAQSIRGGQGLDYPITALGPLAAACEEMASAGQVQPAIAGQSLLGSASLLTQGLFDVETLAGRRPLSLYLLTLGDSGDGKSTAQGVALAPVTSWQREQAKAYAEALRERDHKRPKKEEDRPAAPASPFRLVGDATVEGLRRDLDGGVCSQGVFTDEAAAILAGYGMSPDQRSKTASVFSKLWDSGHLSVSRATAPRVERNGRRVALHWLIQPMAASEVVGDPLLSALGFWPRFLAAWPGEQPPRKALPFRPETLPGIGAYWHRCAELLTMHLPDDAGDNPVLPLSADAGALLQPAFERFEQEARRGELRIVKPFGLRAAEQACRVAGVLSAFAGDKVVTAGSLRGALALVAYSMKTWKAIIEGGASDQRVPHALRLYEWLTRRPGWRESLAVIVNAGPPSLRSKDKRNAALTVLEAAGLVSLGGGAAVALLREPVEQERGT